MAKKKQSNIPEFVFETSWEVCNKVGGIYTVLSSKAKTMVETYNGNIIFIGPDIWKDSPSPWFEEDNNLFTEWKEHAYKNDKLKVRTGRWNVPGKPITILVDFQQFFSQKNDIYKQMWDEYQVNSLHAYGDYDESCMFAYSTGRVIESFYNYNKLSAKNVIAHFNEWMLGMGALYIKSHVPAIATVFTTHATSIGRSIAGNNKPLYNYLSVYHGDQMARELNMEAKHSIEKRAAQEVDCFTTVSNITAKECEFLLERKPEVTLNGFERDLVPTGKEYDKKRKQARKILLNTAEKLFGIPVDNDALLVITSGRYEYRNKGIDVFIDALGRLNQVQQLNKDVIAFVMVPAWVKEARTDLQERLSNNTKEKTPLEKPYITHYLHHEEHDPVSQQIKYLGLDHVTTNKVKVIFVPSYLNGNDGIFNKSYYDLLIGMDVSVFPSYYEPWGYTPHESIAFSVPTITTTLAGFGLWMLKMGDVKGMDDGAEVIRRDDYNFIEVSSDICELLFEMSTKSEKEDASLRKIASDRAALADWEHFFFYYQEAYKKALENTRLRNKE